MPANTIQQSPSQLARSISSQATVKSQALKSPVHPEPKAAPVKNNPPAAQPSSVVSLNGNQKTKANEVYGPASTMANAANSGGFTVAQSGQVEVEIKQSDSAYNNRISWSSDNFKTRNYIGVDNQTGTVNLGSFKAGTKIDFAIENDEGQFFRTGGAANNVDKVDHTRSSQTAKGLEIGFEDLAGGGDRDFNDAIISVRSVATPPANNTNRSGLADGTNPGQGAGRVNSPNTGTENPANRPAPAPVTTAVNSSPASNTNTTVKPQPSLVYSAAVLQNNNRSGSAEGSNSTKTNNNKVQDNGARNPASTTQISGNTISQTVNLQPKAVSALKAYANVAQLTPAKPLNNPQQAIDKAKLEFAPKVEQKTNSETNRASSVKAAVATAIAKQNHSGLADGTNPGQGAGRVNSPNTGTSNPNQVNAMVSKR